MDADELRRCVMGADARTSVDAEIAAISAIATALADLDDETRARILRWVDARYGNAE